MHAILLNFWAHLIPFFAIISIVRWTNTSSIFYGKRLQMLRPLNFFGIWINQRTQDVKQCQNALKMNTTEINDHKTPLRPVQARQKAVKNLTS